MLGAVHEQLRKYISRLPAYIVSIGLLSGVALLTAAVLYSSIAGCGSHRSFEPIGAWFTGRDRNQSRLHASSTSLVDTACTGQIIEQGESSEGCDMSI